MTATPKVAKWAEPPAMDAGAPMPAVYSDETGLTCAYVIGATHSEYAPYWAAHSLIATRETQSPREELNNPKILDR